MVDLHHNQRILEYQKPIRLQSPRNPPHQPSLRRYAHRDVPLYLLPRCRYSLRHRRHSEWRTHRDKSLLEGPFLTLPSNTLSPIFHHLTNSAQLSFVFKCLTDSLILDDFKTALDRLREFKHGRTGSIGATDPVHHQDRAPSPSLPRTKATSDHIEDPRGHNLGTAWQDLELNRIDKL